MWLPCEVIEYIIPKYTPTLYVANWSSPRPYNSKVVLEKSCGFGGSEVVLEEKFQKFQKLAANSLFKVDKDYIK